jgi:hypothetical protein
VIGYQSTVNRRFQGSGFSSEAFPDTRNLTPDTPLRHPTPETEKKKRGRTRNSKTTEKTSHFLLGTLNTTFEAVFEGGTHAGRANRCFGKGAAGKTPRVAEKV